MGSTKVSIVKWLIVQLYLFFSISIISLAFYVVRGHNDCRVIRRYENRPVLPKTIIFEDFVGPLVLVFWSLGDSAHGF